VVKCCGRCRREVVEVVVSSKNVKGERKNG